MLRKLKSHPETVKPVLIFATWRVGLFLIALIGLFYVSTNLQGVPRQYLDNDNQPSFLNIWTRYDSTTYLGIAEKGYVAEPHYAGFFPLYPLLIKLVASPLGNNYLLSSLLISNIALLLGLIFFYQLVKVDYDENLAERSVFYLLLFPTSIFLVSAYTEALFLCLSVLTFYFTRQSRWLLSGLFGFLSALGTSVILKPLFKSLAVISGSSSKRRLFNFRPLKISARIIL